MQDSIESWNDRLALCMMVVVIQPGSHNNRTSGSKSAVLGWAETVSLNIHCSEKGRIE
jgi:hypothetical protein